MAREVIDLTGQRFGKFLVIEKAEKNRFGQSRWKCKCDCGIYKVVDQACLRTGQSKTCGNGRCNPNLVDLTGQRFNRLIVLRYDRPQKNKGARWLCECDCGEIKSILSYSLTSGITSSCGCFCKDINRALGATRNYKHGKVGSKEYRAWAKMKERCNNPNDKRWKDYGGRGITYDGNWETFEKFYQDMGVAPSKNHSLDRINNSLGYSKENCRWATKKQQNNNTRANRLITYNGETHSLAEWGEITLISPVNICQRINKLGWNEERALTTPVKTISRKNKRYNAANIESCRVDS